MAYLIKVSLGEILDKLSILEIKLGFAKEASQKANIQKEFDHLGDIASPLFEADEGELRGLYNKLKSINHQLWVIEDDIRLKEQNQDFGDEFVKLARSVYITNDERAATKRDINTLLNSEFFEEKIYTNPEYANVSSENARN